MAMNYAWQERKKFAVPVITGAVVLLIWYMFILGSINKGADDDLRKRRDAENLLRLKMQAGVPTDDGVGRADRDKATFQKDLKEIQDKLAFRVEEAFKAKEGQSVAAKFGSQRQAVHMKIDAARTPRGLGEIGAQLGFPKTFADIPEPVLAEWLIRLAIVQRVCLLSIECGVSSLGLLEVVPAESQEELSAPADRFLGVLTVKFKVEGNPETLIRLAHGLQKEGPHYLSLEACEVTAKDPTRNILAAVLTAGALVVRPEAPLVAEAKQ